jgi:hypothetical protein
MRDAGNVMRMVDSETRAEVGPPRRPASLWTIWGAFLGGAIIWTVFHLLSYLWVTIYCEGWLLIATTAVSTVATLGVTGLGYRGWKKAEAAGGHDPRGPRPAGTVFFFSYQGLYLNLIFAATIVLTGIAYFFIGCA